MPIMFGRRASLLALLVAALMLVGGRQTAEPVVAVAVEAPPSSPPHRDFDLGTTTTTTVAPARPATPVAPRTVRARADRSSNSPRPSVAPPPTTPTSVGPAAPAGGWKKAQASWYGPGFYGNGTACGQRYTPELAGVAHKTLRCGTLVAFRHQGREVVVPVIDRGPYVTGRMWDLSAATCRALGHCFTGTLEYRIL